ncbi:hypothetical protein ScPMuIL_009799 [Solemya velum]
MADKLTDAELVEELERFGEVVKKPIDRKKRPILIKKLNHLRARENPPVQSKKVSTSRRRRAKEFSDDESDTEAIPSRATRSSKTNQSRNLIKSAVVKDDDLENSHLSNLNSSRLRARLSNDEVPRYRGRNSFHSPPTTDIDNARNEINSKHNFQRPSLQTEKSTTTRNRQYSFLQKQKDYDNGEFSDSDLESNSIYEADKSINTTFSIERGIDDDLKTFSPRTKPTRISLDSKISTVPKKIQRTSEQIPRVSMIILSVMAVFFLLLGISYIFVTGEKITLIILGKKPELLICGETLEEVCYERNRVKKATNIIKNLSRNLSAIAGEVESGDSPRGLTVHQFRKFVENNVKQPEMKDDDAEGYPTMILNLLIYNPHWSILLKSEDGSPALTPDDVTRLESEVVQVTLLKRIIRSVYQIIYGIVLLVSCIFAAVLGIYCLRWQAKTREEEQKKIYCMVEKIIDMLKDNYDMNQKDRRHPPYLAVQHIRDQLLPPSQRRQLQPIWDKAVKFIEANESRIRVENQTIQGEDFAVWRWLQNFPNGKKVWQGQAFGEHSPGSALNYSPTQCLKIRNMFDADVENDEDDWEVYIKDALLEKCKNIHGIVHIFVDKTSEQGCVYMKCSNCDTAFQIYNALHGWWFDGRLVTVKYLRLEHYHDRFPDSAKSLKPMKPSTNKNLSLSQPYYKSTLEMT